MGCSRDRAALARIWTLILGAAAALACAASPPQLPGTATAWGYLRLVPREGVSPGHASDSYADRSLRDVRFVDYSHPGFAVVHVAGPAPRGESAELVIRDERRGASLDPSRAVLAAGGVIRVRNESGDAHAISDRVGGVLARLAPGESVEIPAPESVTHALYLLDVPGADALVFVAPGAYAVVSDSGRFELRGLPPGPTRLSTWHPRFPPVSRVVDLVADESLRFDLEVGVGGLSEAPHSHP